jgi:hypothetical protein
MRWVPISLLPAIISSSAGQDVPPKKPANEPEIKFPALLSAKPLKANPDDDTLQRLLKARYNEALEEARWEYWFHRWAPGAGVAMADDQEQRYGPWQRVLQAGLEVFDKPAEKVALLQGYLELVREDERDEQARYDAGRNPIRYVHRARYERLETEARLLRAKREAGAAAK